jgi:hypothetical protein
MKVIIVYTKQEYTDLMLYLEEKCYKWHSGHLPTKFNAWVKSDEPVGVGLDGHSICASVIRHWHNMKKEEIVSYTNFMLSEKPRPININKHVIEAIEKLYG